MTERFDMDSYRKITYEDRTEEVVVHIGTEERSFLVRGLTGEELSRARESAQATKSGTKALAQAFSTTSKEAAAKVAEVLGEINGTGDAALDYYVRIGVLFMGSVEPKLQRADAVKFAKDFPEAFHRLTTKVYELTGLGRLNPKESKPSTKMGG